MQKISLFLTLLFFFNVTQAKDLECLRFDNALFSSKNSWNNPLYVALVKGNNHKVPPYVFTTYKNKLYDNGYLMFYKKSKNTRIYNGECDSAYLSFHKNKGFQLSHLEFSNSDEDNSHSFSLRSHKEKQWTKGEKVKCPQHVYKGRYVCYETRSHSKTLEYKGCERSIPSCKSINKEHFGQYPNEEATYHALFRCYNSNPKFISKLKQRNIENKK